MGTQVTCGDSQGRQGSKLTGPFSDRSRGWGPGARGQDMGSGLAEKSAWVWWQFHQVCDLQKSLHSRAPSFLIHQMSGHLIFKTFLW